VLERIGRLNTEWDGLVSDIDAFYDHLGQRTLGDVLSALFLLRISEHGAVRWGDKTPSYVRHLPFLSQLFPGSKFVHLIRDARDATLSAQKKWGAERWYMDNFYLISNWRRCVESGQEAGNGLAPDRYMEARYEALVADPQRTIGQICSFLDEELHEAMLDHGALARQQIGPGGHVEVREPISTGSVERWRTEMTAFDQKVADRVAGPTLSTLGYPLAGLGPFSGGEQARLTMLRAKFACTDLARRTLSSLGMLTLNRGKRKRR
jgi:hypothetical protein